MTCAPPHHTTRSSSWHPVSADHRDVAESASPEGQLRIFQASFAPALAGGRETMSRMPRLWASCARGSVAMVMPAAELPATIAPARSAARGSRDLPSPSRRLRQHFGLPDLELDDGGRLCRDRPPHAPAGSIHRRVRHRPGCRTDPTRSGRLGALRSRRARNRLRDRYVAMSLWSTIGVIHDACSFVPGGLRRLGVGGLLR